MTPPTVSIVTPVYRPRPDHLRAMLHSVAAQTDPTWQHVLVDDGSQEAETARILDEAASDRRMLVLTRESNGGIVAATNDGIAAATGDYVAFLDQDDVVNPDAVEWVRAALADTPDADLLYTDEDKIDVDVVSEPFAKPDFAPERLRGNMFLGHLLVVRRSLLLELGGLRAGFDGSQDHDLALRVTERGGAVVHLPRFLYHWRRHSGSTAQDPGSKPAAAEAGVRAVQDHCDRVGMDATVSPTDYPGFYRLRRRPKPGSLASIVIPTRGTVGEAFGGDRCFVVEAVRSIELHRYAVDHEYVVVADVTDDMGYLDDLRAIAGDRLRVVPYDRSFNFSEKVNLGALHAHGDLLAVLNDDVEVITPDWLDTLAAIAQQDDVGAVGCLLRFDDGLLQHGGHLYGLGEATHAYFAQANPTGEFGDLLIDRETSGVTAACLVQRRDVWWEVGGFTETLPANFNDVDYCMKITAAGFRIVTAASAELFHFESRTRRSHVKSWEVNRLVARWGRRLERDPYAPYLTVPR